MSDFECSYIFHSCKLRISRGIRFSAVSNCGAALDSVVDDQLSETGNQERRRDSNTIKQTVLVITDKKPSDNTSKPIEKVTIDTFGETVFVISGLQHVI